MRAATRNLSRLVFATAASLVAAASCGGSGGDLPTQPGGGGALVTQIVITPDGGTIVAGQTLTFAAQPRDASGNPVNQSVSWSTSDPAIATVALGAVTALKAGTTSLTATNGVVSKSVTVTVIPAIAEVVVTPSPTNVIITQTAQLTATPRDAAGAAITGRTVTWTSTDSAIARVSATGLVTARTLGTTTITAAAEGKTGTATVVVVPIPVASVTIAPLAEAFVVGDAKQLTATTKDSIGGILGRAVTWSSSNPAVATVTPSGGVVNAVAPGPVTITATSENKTGTLDLVVRQVGSVTVTPSPMTVAAGSAKPLTATVADVNSQPLPGRTVAWATSNAAVATVSTTGVVTGVSAGIARISASSGGKTGESNVTVLDLSAPTVVGLTVTTPLPVDVSTAVDSVELSAIVKDAGGSGVQRVDIAATTPDGRFTSSCTAFTPATGTVANGTFKCHVIIPAHGQNGDWTLSMVVFDAAVNHRSLGTADLVNAGLTSRFAVRSLTPDTTKPTLDSLVIAPLIVDVSNGSQVVTADARLKDAGSGVARFDFNLISPTGGSSIGCSALAPRIGDRANGSWHCEATIPAGAAPGQWSVTVGVVDAAFNSDLGSLPGQITVKNTAPDADAPVFTSLSVDPQVVDLTTGAKVLTVTAKLTDAGTGVDRFDFRAVAPDGTRAECSSLAPEPGGTRQNGTWVCHVSIPPSVVGGDWQIFVQATDKALNVRAPTQAQIAAFGPTKVTVIAP
jgi:uncharacterized protein YjdB